MQYVNGGSLDQLVYIGSDENNEFPWLVRVSLANDINEGLSYLHSRGIFHRDLTSKVIAMDNIHLIADALEKSLTYCASQRTARQDKANANVVFIDNYQIFIQ